MSKVRVEDTESFDYDIYMNHVLDHKGYRFFQASFNPDEGTILSVNHDWCNIHYLFWLYFLYLSMIGIFFVGKTRFKTLKSFRQNKKEKECFDYFGCLLIMQSFSQSVRFRNFEKNAFLFDLIINGRISKEHSNKFGQLVIQDAGGRMKSANTFSSELLRKVSKRQL